ncbi:MAG: phosphatase PAP2 family protein [Deltaproteobacteria bacterium]|nr:phosphatase PAP2 family protein [Deltaproteobacteria bacterium]MBW2420566.1 phosphatase PAP2 family protein [Deltaproteobacteria bacterium]
MHAWEIDCIVWIQQQGGPALDRFFEVYTNFGGSYYLYLIPLLLWCVDYRLGLRVLTVFVATVFFNTTLKEWLGQPRPFQVDSRVSSEGELGYGLPSGHAQLVVVFWGVIADWVDRRWFWTLAVVIMLSMGFSRIYLGVHFMSDVLPGWLLGALTLALFLRFVPDADRLLGGRPPATVAGWALAAAAFCFLFDLALVRDHNRLVAGAAGFTAGAGLGAALALGSLEFSGHGALWQRALRYVVGMLPTLLLLGLMSELGAPEGVVGNLVVMADLAVIGVWLTFAAPWLFERLRLSPTARAGRGSQP